MRSTARLFDEFGAALQFPDYFGENWAALDECLADLSWIPAEGYALLVVQPEAVLADNNGDSLDVLRTILVRVAEHWATPISRGQWWDRPAIPFHVVLQFEPDADASAMRRWGIKDDDILQDSG